MKHNRFTLVELLVVIAIISILAGILLPVLNRAMAAAKRTACVAQQQQIGAAYAMYADAFAGYFPSPCQQIPYGGCYQEPSYWFILLGPYAGYREWRSGIYPVADFIKTLFVCPAADPSICKPWARVNRGYGMNRFIPPSTTATFWQTALVTFPKPRLIKKPGMKILLADGRGFELGHTWEFAQSDPSLQYKFDRIRHDRGANTLYCDFHAKWASEAEILLRKDNGELF